MSRFKYTKATVSYDGSLPPAVEQQIDDAVPPAGLANTPGSAETTVTLAPATSLSITVHSANTEVYGVTATVNGSAARQYFDPAFAYLLTHIEYPLGDDRDTERIEPDFEPDTLSVIAHDSGAYEISFSIAGDNLYTDFVPVTIEFEHGSKTLRVPPSQAASAADARSFLRRWWNELSESEQRQYVRLDLDTVVTAIELESSPSNGDSTAGDPA